MVSRNHASSQSIVDVPAEEQKRKEDAENVPPPFADVITPSELYKHLTDGDDAPSILVIDLRPSDDFRVRHVHKFYIIAISWSAGVEHTTAGR